MSRARRTLVAPIPDIVVACVSTAAADELAAHLRHEAEYGTGAVSKVDNHLVYVPWSGSLTFLEGLFARAVERGWTRPQIAQSALAVRTAEQNNRRAA